MTQYVSEHNDAAKTDRRPASVRVELGRRRIGLDEMDRIETGQVVELDAAVDEPVNVYVDGRLFARGEAVSTNGKFAVRVLEFVGVAKPGAARTAVKTV